MQETDPTYAQSEEPHPSRPGLFRRYLFLWMALAVLILLAIVPPLITVNRLQRRIATSIGDSLGRPVHLDRVTLNLLPLPGFTLDNLVVGEDPAFGSEPIIRANSVRVTLRFRSLWTRRVEFSTISFTDPSVNLVHLANGKWNLESILLQASHIEAAPTAQKRAGSTPRFPYIEATGARLNFKFDQEKIPLSFTNADFALWLPNPQQWRLRLKASPARTDTNVSGTGTIQIEGTLGRAASLAQVPIHLQGEWRDAPLGGASYVLFGRDAGWRGNMTLSANAQGTVGNSAVEIKLSTGDARRADFVPRSPLAFEAECLGTAANLFHSFNNVRCSWPPAGSSGTQVVMISGTLPDIRQLGSATVNVSIPGLPADRLLTWLRVLDQRFPDDISMGGTVTGNLSYHPGYPLGHHSNPPAPAYWDGAVFVTGAKLTGAGARPPSLLAGDIAIRSEAQPKAVPHAHGRRSSPPPPPESVFVLEPTALALGGKEPATLEGRFDAQGYTLHLSGMATPSRLRALAAALPSLGEGLAGVLTKDSAFNPASGRSASTPSSPTSGPASGPVHTDLRAVRQWGTAQVWTEAPPYPTTRHPHRAQRP
ncbi:MAG TPA: AsmA family protein [Edaphobacter sp.]|nr:AsmA family protein [Edaphobacter sp.]